MIRVSTHELDFILHPIYLRIGAMREGREERVERRREWSGGESGGKEVVKGLRQGMILYGP